MGHIRNKDGHIVLSYQSELQTIPLRGKDFSRAILAGLDLCETDLSEINLTDSIIFATILARCRFLSANLSGAVVSRSDLSSISGAGIYLLDATIVKTDMRHADLYWACFFRAKCLDSRFCYAKLAGADLKESFFERVDLTGVDFGIDNVGGATDLSGATFVDTCLVDANLRGTLLTGTTFDGSTYSIGTQFPQGFDPAGHGMILVR
jgi:uncharacterized protein YjbI with pentapeptide repeats